MGQKLWIHKARTKKCEDTGQGQDKDKANRTKNCGYTGKGQSKLLEQKIKAK